jgi:hypothetical protein
MPDAEYCHHEPSLSPGPHRVARGMPGLWTRHQDFGAKEAIESEGIENKTGTYPLSLNPNENWWLKERIVHKLGRGVLAQHAGCFPYIDPPPHTHTIVLSAKRTEMLPLPCRRRRQVAAEPPELPVRSRRTALAPWCCTARPLGRRSTEAPHLTLLSPSRGTITLHPFSAICRRSRWA